MNRCYRLLWNRSRECVVVASELARGCSKPARGQRSVQTRTRAWLLALPLSLVSTLGMAAGPSELGVLAASHALVAPATGPAGGSVTAGSGTIRQDGLTTTIDQHSQNLSLNWQSFDVGAASTVNSPSPMRNRLRSTALSDPTAA